MNINFETHEEPCLITVDYRDVISKDTDLSQQLSQAFGNDGLGIIAIRNVPNFVEHKKALFSKTHRFTRLGEEILDKQLTDHKSLYNAGWSFGKEKLKGDKPDLSKGSFYYNPLTDMPGTEADREQFPLSYPCNVWPKDEDLPGFKDSAVSLGKLLHNVVVDLSCHIDHLVKSKVDGYKEHTLYEAMQKTDKAKARLLYYFPLRNVASNECSAEIEEDSWIGWHNDSGFLTALAGDCYVDDQTGCRIDNPDPDAGLYVTQRSGKSIRVDIPPDCMAIQMGECVQIITGGLLVATPHCVRGARSNAQGVARISHPCFIDTAPNFPLSLPKGRTSQQVFESSVSSKVPPLSERWTSDGMKFGDFLHATFSRYYDWSAMGDKK